MYKVRFKANGEARYGIVNKYAEESKLLTEGHLLVEDAITPETFILTRDQVEEISLDNYPSEFDIYVENKREEALQISKSLKEVGPGKIFTIHVDDGFAYYEVVAVKGQKAHIEWRAFTPDRYIAPGFGYGGEFDKKRISDLIRSEERIAYLDKRAIS